MEKLEKLEHCKTCGAPVCQECGKCECPSCPTNKNDDKYSSKHYALNTNKNFYQSLLDVYRMKMAEPYEYINPNAMSEILKTIEKYQRQEVDDNIWSYVQDMYGA